jgi:hypothetical protein
LIINIMNKLSLALLLGATQSTKLTWPVDEQEDKTFLTDEQWLRKQHELSASK